MGLLQKLRALVLVANRRALALDSAQCKAQCGCTLPPPDACCVRQYWICGQCAQPQTQDQGGCICCDCGRVYTVTVHLEFARQTQVSGLVALPWPTTRLYNVNRSEVYVLDAVSRVRCVAGSGVTEIDVLSMSGHWRVLDPFRVPEYAITGEDFDQQITLNGTNDASVRARGYMRGALDLGMEGLGCGASPLHSIRDAVSRLCFSFRPLYPGGEGPDEMRYRFPRFDDDASGCAGTYRVPNNNLPNPNLYTLGLEGSAGSFAAHQLCQSCDYTWNMSGGVWGFRSYAHGAVAESVGANSCGITGSIRVQTETPCTPSTCVAPPTVGACCGVFPYSFGGFTNCAIKTASDCAAAAGTYVGDGTACANAHCEPVGACCQRAGGCVVMRRSQCTLTGGGRFMGANTTCHAGICESVACCVPDGIGGYNCQMTRNGSACAALGGHFFADGRTCAADPCTPRGPCCIDGGANGCYENTTQGQCAAICAAIPGNHGCTWFETGGTCASVGCTPQPGPIRNPPPTLASIMERLL